MAHFVVNATLYLHNLYRDLSIMRTLQGTGMIDASAPNPSGVVLCNPFKWDILLFIILIKNHVVVCVPSTTAKWITFCNHKNRKVVGDKHNVLVSYVDASAPSLSVFVLCNLFKWDILLFISDQNSCCLCAFHNSKTNFIPQLQEQKSCRRQTQCSSILCGWLGTQPISCCSFLIKILLFLSFHNSEINFKTYTYLPVGVCCIETPTNHLHTPFVKIN